MFFPQGKGRETQNTKKHPKELTKNLVKHRRMRKAPPLKSLVLHFSVLQNRPNRGLLIFSKICLKSFMQSTNTNIYLCESEPVSDNPYLKIQAQAKRHIHILIILHKYTLPDTSLTFSKFHYTQKPSDC